MWRLHHTSHHIETITYWDNYVKFVTRIAIWVAVIENNSTPSEQNCTEALRNHALLLLLFSFSFSREHDITKRLFLHHGISSWEISSLVNGTGVAWTLASFSSIGHQCGSCPSLTYMELFQLESLITVKTHLFIHYN